MFQTDLIQYLQSFDFPWLISLMQGITGLGYGIFYLILIPVLFFGIDFKKGFLITQILFWTAAITLILKDLFALPRPFHVDSLVKNLDKGMVSPEDIPFTGGDAEGFFELLPKDIVDYYRNLSPTIPFGFPSGHTSMTVALYVTLMRLFNHFWLRMICLALLVLIPFSRMYLGVHFLGDILGGYLLGGLIFQVFYQVIFRRIRLGKFLKQKTYPFKSKYYLFYAYLILSPLLLMLISASLFQFSAILLGLNLSFLFLMRSGLPESYASLLHRVLRVVVSGLILFGVFFVLRYVLSITELSGNPYVQFLQSTLTTFLFLWGGVKLNLQFGLFGR